MKKFIGLGTFLVAVLSNQSVLAAGFHCEDKVSFEYPELSVSHEESKTIIEVGGSSFSDISEVFNLNDFIKKVRFIAPKGTCLTDTQGLSFLIDCGRQERMEAEFIDVEGQTVATLTNLSIDFASELIVTVSANPSKNKTKLSARIYIGDGSKGIHKKQNFHIGACK